jgi:hypothetical protein
MSTNLELSSLLASADRRSLAAVVIHLSGNPKAVPDLRDRAQIEKTAAALLPAFLSGEKPVGSLSDEVLHAAMRLAAGGEVPAEYGPLVREQMGFGPPVEPKPLKAPAGFKVVIIGAGVSGVLAAISSSSSAFLRSQSLRRILSPVALGGRIAIRVAASILPACSIPTRSRRIPDGPSTSAIKPVS